MKMFLILFLLLPVLSFADSGHMKAGVMLEDYAWEIQKGKETVTNHDSVNTTQLFFVEYQQSFDFLQFLYVSGTVRTWVLKDNGNTFFSPIFTDYTVDLGLQFENVKVGLEHGCYHPQNVEEGIRSPIFSKQAMNTSAYLSFEWRQ